ncbi:hypothetical protein EZV62_015906 [Acer yangbiense]|uniref:DUF4283 domain-containing protein n=1 Tax=Acer yangbiense TaxID=1000413 RepID=A0A5C7HM31_9ROSI|nr:hypothetical protein EZV62_015906 [Acer yangbiense]
MVTSTQRIHACYSHLVAEAMAMLHGIIFEIETRLITIIVEFDALGVVKLVNVGGSFFADIGLVVNDIVTHFKGIKCGLMVFMSKKANYVAYTLSKMTLGVNEDCFWLKEYPPCVDRGSIFIMESKELAKLCENLSLADEDSEIHQMFGGIENEGVKDVHHCLVGKVLSSRRVNREAFKTVIEQIWSPFGNVDIEVVGENTFMFYFANPEDRNRIWRRGPWHFDRHLIALEKPEGTGNISQLSFSKAEFWVQIHDIPIMCMNRCMAKWLAA